MTRFERLAISNFRAFCDEQVIEFPDSQTQNLMLVYGRNGGGKTSLLNAIRWCLYGETLGRTVQAVPKIEITNQTAAANGNFVTKVSLTFVHEDKRYVLTRVMEPIDEIEKPRFENQFKKDAIYLTCDDQAYTVEEAQVVLNRIFPSQIARFSLFDGELLAQYESLVSEAKGEEQGKKIKKEIESILGIPAIEHAAEAVQIVRQDKLRQQNKEQKKNEKNAKNVKQLEVVLARFEDLTKSQQARQRQMTKSSEECERLKQKLEALASGEELAKREKELKEDQKEAYSDLEQCHEQEKLLLKAVHVELFEPIVASHLERALFLVKCKQDLLEEVTKINVYVSTKESLIKTGKCGTCGAESSVSDRSKMEAEIKNEKERINKLNLQLKGINDENTSSQEMWKLSRYFTGRDQLNSLKHVHSTKVQTRLKLNKVDKQLKETLKGLRQFDSDEIRRDRKKYEEKKKLHDQLSRANEVSAKEMKSLLAEKKRLEELVTKESEGNSGLKTEIDICDNLKKIFELGIDQIADDLRASVNDYATSAFQELSNVRGALSLKINESFGLDIVNEQGNRIVGRSSGQEQIVALSLIRALSQATRRQVPIVVDTPLGRLDIEHRKNFLRMAPEFGTQVVFLVHEGEIARDGELIEIANRRTSRIYEIVKPDNDKPARIQKI